MALACFQPVHRFNPSHLPTRSTCPTPPTLSARRLYLAVLHAAAAKRAAAAEDAVAAAGAKLEAAERRNNELQWQVSMLAPQGEGQGEGRGRQEGQGQEADRMEGEQRQGAAGWLAGALKGCVAPRHGRGR